MAATADSDWSESKSSRTVLARLGPMRITPSSRHVNERCWLVPQVLFMPEQTLPKRLLFLCLILASRTSCYVWTHGSHHWRWMIFCSWPWQLWPWSTTSLFWDLVPSIGSLVRKFLSLFHVWTNFDPWFLPAPSPSGPNGISTVHLWFFHKH